MLCEICEERTILQQHHIRGQKVDNAHRDFNITNICSNCHTLIHHGKIIIEDRLMTTGGYKLIWHREGENSMTNDDATPHLI
jgi:hypothetical protein